MSKLTTQTMDNIASIAAELTHLPQTELAERYFAYPKATRRAIYDALPQGVQIILRPHIEARRGVIRDGEGHIIRSKAWLTDRILFLKQKQKESGGQRLANIKTELAKRQAELKGAE